MSTNIHASCVAIGGKGVLLMGPSGAGKSDLALRLIDGGAKLVADDRCEIFLRGGNLHARAPGSIAGLIEIRGLGIIALPHVKSSRVALAVQLGAHPARLPERNFYVPPTGLKPKAQVPLILMKAEAASAPARIRAALMAFSQGRFRETFNPKSRP
jgi:HPr kinase/phosphorylase